MANSKAILLGVGVVAAAGIAYLAIDGRVGPEEGVEGAIGAAEQHQLEKNRYYEELNTREIKDLGKIAAEFERAPAEAEKMLEQHGWSKEDFEEKVKAVRSNQDLNKVFEAAKKLAAQT